MWNEEIRQKIINELNAELDAIKPEVTFENHSYVDSIFTSTSNMFKPLVPNYYENVITGMRTIKEVPVHTLAFSDSFENSIPEVGFAYGRTSTMPSTYTLDRISEDRKEIYEINEILDCSNSVTISLTPEQRGVALAKRNTWKETLMKPVDLNKKIDIAGPIKKFCSIQINI